MQSKAEIRSVATMRKISPKIENLANFSAADLSDAGKFDGHNAAHRETFCNSWMTLKFDLRQGLHRKNDKGDQETSQYSILSAHAGNWFCIIGKCSVRSIAIRWSDLQKIVFGELNPLRTGVAKIDLPGTDASAAKRGNVSFRKMDGQSARESGPGKSAVVQHDG